MAYDEGLAQRVREALAHRPDLTERKMFGGLCFMLNGNMLCGVHKGGGMFRVGKDNEAAALELPGVAPLNCGSTQKNCSPPAVKHRPGC